MTPRYIVERIKYGLGYRIVNTATGRSVPGEYQSQARAQRAARARDLEFADGKVLSGYGAGRSAQSVARERESGFLRSFRRTLAGSLEA